MEVIAYVLPGHKSETKYDRNRIKTETRRSYGATLSRVVNPNFGGTCVYETQFLESFCP